MNARILRSGFLSYSLPICIGSVFTVICLSWAYSDLQFIRAQTKREYYTSVRLAESRISGIFNNEASRIQTLLSQTKSLDEKPTESGVTFWKWDRKNDVLVQPTHPARMIIPTFAPELRSVKPEMASDDAVAAAWNQVVNLSLQNSPIKKTGFLVLCEHSKKFVLITPHYDIHDQLLGIVSKSIPSTTILEALPDGVSIVDPITSAFLAKENTTIVDSERQAMIRGEVVRDALYSSARTINLPQVNSNWKVWCAFSISQAWARPQTGIALNYPVGCLALTWLIVLGFVKSAKRGRDRQRRLIGNLVQRIIWITNEEGDIDYVLGRITTQLGWKELDYANVNIQLFVHPEDRPKLIQVIGEIKGQIAREITIEVRFETKDREYRWYEVTVSDMTEIPEINGIVVTAHDIELKKHATDHILASKRAAEKANEAKSDFLSRMSHELRTPLNAILGFGQLLEMEPTTGRQAENVNQILIAGRHLLNLVNDILDIARIETRKVNLSVEAVNIKEVVSESFALLGPFADKHQIKLIFEDENCPNVWSDRQRLKQVLLNLVSNGIKYNNPGGTVWIRTVNGKHGLSIEVTDTGIGIESHYLARVFTPFDRLGSETSEIEGSGLGLALSKTLVEAMGASLEVTSVYGQGSTFKVNFRPAAIVITESEKPDGNDSFNNFGSPDDYRVLLIEDNVVNLRYVSKVVDKMEGVALISAKEGGIGIEMARAHNPDLILLDLDLPDLSGKEVLQVLRADSKTSTTRVVVMSAETNPHIVEEILLCGADQFVTKPVDVNRLIELFSTEKKAA